ncbi:MAG TPA: two-component regulator propeller domain-containing protein, partial [Chitinophagaceae bacterium]|nr:two-component regulator propeller domain-containing protein [Chitinophagaceae bacterium]
MLTVCKRSIVLVLAVLTAYGPLYAQSFDYGFKHLTTDHGLSHDNIHAITRDDRGFMWFGTMNGLSRFDGLQFKVFKHKVKDSTSLPHNFILSITSHAGFMWVAHAAGVARFDPATEKFTPVRFPDSSVTNPIAQLVKARNGQVYIARDNKLYLLDPHKNVARFICQLSKQDVGARLFEGPGSTIWVVMQPALYRFDTKTNKLDYVQGTDATHSSQPGILFAYTDPLGSSWAGSWEGGLLKYNDTSRKFEPFASIPFVVSLTADVNFKENNLLWVCGGYSGLNLINVKTKRTIDLPKNIN